jgi:DNA-binding LytR/AlgR family response regulator
MLNFVICDDSSPVLIRFSKMLEAIFIKHNIDAKVGLATDNLSKLFNYIENTTIDVLILDINLKSDISGCDIAEMVRKKNKSVYIIFYTGHLEYALVAYKYKTFDYLCKPLTQDRLEETVLRLLEDVNVSSSNFVKINSKTVINENDIKYIKKDGMKLVFCTFERNYSIYSSFSKFSNCLSDNFIRCHKSFIININNVTKVDAKNNFVLFNNNEFCSIGAKYKNSFLEVFNNGDSSDRFRSVNK